MQTTSPLLSQLIAERLLQRLEVFRLEPSVIINVSADDVSTSLLTKRYPQAQVHEIKVSENIDFPWEINSVDMIMANLTLLHIKNPQLILLEFQRILRPEGLLLLTTLGRDSFMELQKDFGFVDMHDVGDQLLQCQLIDPVTDVEYFTLQYSTAERLREDMKSVGLPPMIETVEEKKSVTLELIYGQAWGNQYAASFINENGEVLIPLSAIQKI